MERNKLYLLHIQDSIDAILEYKSKTNYEEFAKKNIDYDAILMRMVVIGESVNELSSHFREKHHNLPWHKAVGFRNQIAHGYIDIKPEIVWDTIKKDLPELKNQIEKIIKERS